LLFLSARIAAAWDKTARKYFKVCLVLKEPIVVPHVADQQYSLTKKDGGRHGLRSRRIVLALGNPNSDHHLAGSVLALTAGIARAEGPGGGVLGAPNPEVSANTPLRLKYALNGRQIKQPTNHNREDYPTERTTMDKDRIKGSAEQAKGIVKETAGKVVGDAKLEAEGKAERAKGEIRNAVGGLKDTLRGK
jgi:uncharacterized protein YjbJ (UPF0337 family)